MKNVADIYSLSPMQELMLLHTKTTTRENDNLFNQIVYRLSGSLDSDIYRQAWQALIDRHSALRTLFIWQENKKPVQVVLEKVDLPWKTHDWRKLSAAAQEAALDELLAADRVTGFDAARAPLMRLQLIRLADMQYWLLWSSHHLVIDRWCIGILLAELREVYGALVAGRRQTLGPPPRYRDYIAWLAEQDDAAAKTFWQTTLKDLATRPLPRLPTAANKSRGVAALESEVTGSEFSALNALVRVHDLTFGALVTAGWALVLATTNDVTDTIFGLTVSGRPAELPDVVTAVGCYINNVPMRLSLQLDSTLITWLKHVQDAQLALQPYEYVSPAQIQEWVDSSLPSPLFESLVIYQAPVELAVPANLDMQFERGGIRTGYPLSLTAVPYPDRLALLLNYDEDRVHLELAEQMITALRTFLQTAPQNRDATIASLLEGIQIVAPVQQTEKTSTDRPESKQTYIPPQSPVEIALASLWADILGVVRPIGLQDRFDELGGHSLSALEIIRRIQQEFGVDLSVLTLFEQQTISELALTITLKQLEARNMEEMDLLLAEIEAENERE